MKKYLVIGLLLFVPFVSKAAFDASLKYGNKGDAVKEVQEFLVSQGICDIPATGNFYSLTLKCVKSFQTKQGLKATGIWGQSERDSANQISGLNFSNTVALNTPPDGFHFMDWAAPTAAPTAVTPTPNSVPAVDFCYNLTGNQTVLPDGYYRSVDNNCYPQIVNPAPAPAVKVLDCEKNSTGHIQTTLSAKLSQHISNRDSRLDTYGDVVGTSYSLQLKLYEILSNGQGKLMGQDYWPSELPMGTYYIYSAKSDIFATPINGVLDKPCQTLNFVIDDIY